MMRKIVLATSAAVCCVASTFGQSGQAGTNAFPFLYLDYDARTIATGGVSVAMPNDLYGVVTNPAAAGYISKRQVVCGYRSVIDDVWGSPIAVALPYYNWGTFALSLVNLSYGSLNEVDEGPDGRPLSTGISWHSYSVAGSLTWAKVVWESLSVGGSLREIHDYIGNSGGTAEHYSADAVVVQAGLQYRWLGSRVIAGFALNNAGFMIANYTDQTENLMMPLSVAAGVSYSPDNIPNLRLALDLMQPTDGFLTYKLGAEVDIYKKYLTLRAGYSFSEPDLESQLKVLQGESNNGYQKTNWAGFCFGFGVNTDIGLVNAGIDAGVQLLQDMDPALSVSMIVGF
jgi:hypothetical protein